MFVVVLASAAVEENGTQVAVKDALSTKDNVIATTKESFGIVEAMHGEFSKELHTPTLKSQIMNGSLAFIVGLVMCINGEFVFKQIVVVIMFLLSAVLTTAELRNGATDKLGLVGIYIVATEVSLIVAIATYYGFRGVKFLLGAVLGLMLAAVVHKALFALLAGSRLQHMIPENSVTLILFGTLLVAAGIWLLNGSKSQCFQVFLGSFFGGSLVASSILYFFTLLAVFNKDSFGSQFQIPDVAHAPAWIDFWKALIVPYSTQGKVGIFAGSDYDQQAHFSVDGLIGLVLWMIIGIFGFKMQLWQEKKGGPCITEKIENKMLQGVEAAALSAGVEVHVTAPARGAGCEPLLGASSPYVPSATGGRSGQTSQRSNWAPPA